MGLDTKICRTCKKDLPIAIFYKDRNGNHNHDNQCKYCMIDERFERRWGFTYAKLIQMYGDKCGICGEYETALSRWSNEVKRLQVDHDHNCCKRGCVKCLRGLLCLSCNKKLYAIEDRQWLQAALDYLEDAI